MQRMNAQTLVLSEQDVVGITVIIIFCTLLLVLKASSGFRDKFEAGNENEQVVNELLQDRPQPQVGNNGPNSDLSTNEVPVHEPRTTVLIVDDDPVTRKQLRRHLEKLKFRVAEVSDGPSAVRLYQEGKRFCLVLMDYEMPDMNGLLATKAIRKFDNDVIIVGSTIHDPATKEAEFRSAGANMVEIKPISAERLQEYVTDYNLQPTDA